MTTCNSLYCDESKFIVVDGGISEYDEYFEIECCHCGKCWKKETDYLPKGSSDDEAFLW